MNLKISLAEKICENPYDGNVLEGLKVQSIYNRKRGD